MADQTLSREVIAHLQTKLDNQEQEIGALSARLNASEQRVDDVRLTMNGKLDGVEARLNTRIDTLETNLTKTLREMELRILAARSNPE